MLVKFIHLSLFLSPFTTSFSQTKTPVVFSILLEDSVCTTASCQYSDASFLRRLMMGRNYRQAWSTPVKLPVFYLSKSGFQVEELGGGKQTQSLHLKNEKGEIWVLRSVDKDVSPAVPKWLLGSSFHCFKQDLISADHPYGALVVAELLKAVGIVAPEPVYCFVADEEALGNYRSLFGGTVCMLEQYAPTIDGSNTESTETIMRKAGEEPARFILQKELLKTRVVDMLVGDWDRHPDQYRWGSVIKNSGKYYYAIPRDRDHALFYTNGVLPKLLELKPMPYLGGFKNAGTNFKKLNKKAWSFDAIFLKGLSENEWACITKELQAEMSDPVIEKAVQQLPPEILAIDGTKIKECLIARRNGLLQNVMNYYHFLFQQ